MGTGGQFGQHREEDISDKLNRMDGILPLCVRIDEFRGFKKEIEGIPYKVESLKNDLSDLKNLVVEVVMNNHDGLTIQTDRKIEKHEKVHDLIKESIFNLKEKLDVFRRDINYIAQSCEENGKVISSLQQMVKDGASAESVRLLYKNIGEINNNLSSHGESISSVKIENLSLRNKINKLEEILSTHADESRKKSEILSSHSDKLDDLKESNFECVSNISRSFDSFQQSISKEIDSKISQIKFPPSGPSSEEIKKLISAATELVSMDAKISVSRTNNNEMKLNILEKKIEQLALAVKKVELTQ
jgi:archaellum component FlaC